MEQGFQLLKSKGEVKIKPPGAQDTWISLLLDPDGRAYVADNVISRPPVISTLHHGIHRYPWIFGMLD